MRLTAAEDSARLYQKSREKYSAGDYPGSLALIRAVRSRSNPPQLDRAEAMVLDAMWGRAIEQYQAKKYDDALETIATLETRANPPELVLAKGIILFYSGDLDQAARCFLDESLADDPRALAPLGFVYFERGHQDLAISAWAHALAVDPESRLAALGSSMIAFRPGGSRLAGRVWAHPGGGRHASPMAQENRPGGQHHGRHADPYANPPGRSFTEAYRSTSLA